MDPQALSAFRVSAFVILAASGAASPAPAQRLVRENQLTSTALPALRIEVAPAFRFVGTVPFRLGSVAEGERFIFVDARDTVVERMVIAQFEAIRPASDQRYNYSFQDAQLVAGYRFRANAFAFSNAAAWWQELSKGLARRARTAFSILPLAAP